MARTDFPKPILADGETEGQVFLALGCNAICMQGTVGGTWRLQWRFADTENAWENYHPTVALTADRKYAEFNGSPDLEYRIVGGTQDAQNPTTAFLVRVPTVIFK